jgi:hypothetical protein
MHGHGGRGNTFLGAALLFAGFMTLGSPEPALGQLLHSGDRALPSFEVATLKPDNDSQLRINFQISSGRFAARIFR